MLHSFLSCLLLIHFALAIYHDQSSIDTRIVGGDEVNITDYPYQVSLRYLTNYRCGGAIIARTWILTAAACFIRLGTVQPEDFLVRVGSSYRDSEGQLLNTTRFIIHSNYSSSTNDYDIAVVQLQEPVQLSESAQVIRLPNNGNIDIDGYLAKVAGWGATLNGGTGSNELRAVDLPVLSQSVCRDMYPTYEITDRMICAGYWEGEKDVCSGDLGGPLVIDSVVYGIVSWGLGCASPRRPWMYTNVGVLRDWITEQTGI